MPSKPSSPTPKPENQGSAPEARPPTEVPATARRRTFTAAYKLSVLEQADACTSPGDVGALLRREGLYSSHLSDWSRARREGALGALRQRRGPKARRGDPLAQENDRLKEENARLRARLEQAEAIIEVQKKVSEILQVPMRRPPCDGSA